MSMLRHAWRGFLRIPEPDGERSIRRRSNKVGDSLTDSFENVDSFEHKIFAAMRMKRVTLHFLTGPKIASSPSFFENGIVDFPVYEVPSSTTKTLRDDLQPHESPQALEERFCTWHANGTPASDKALECFITLLLSGTLRRVRSR